MKPVFEERNKHLGDIALIPELEKDPENFHRYFRMNKENFNDILSLVTPFIEKQRTKFREPIPAKHRLALTLRYKISLVNSADTTIAIGGQYRGTGTAVLFWYRYRYRQYFCGTGTGTAKK